MGVPCEIAGQTVELVLGFWEFRQLEEIDGLKLSDFGAGYRKKEGSPAESQEIEEIPKGEEGYVATADRLIFTPSVFIKVFRASLVHAYGDDIDARKACQLAEQLPGANFGARLKYLSEKILTLIRVTMQREAPSDEIPPAEGDTGQIKN